MELPVRKRSLVGWIIIVLLLAPFVAYTVPGIIGAEGAYIVLSGSMEPAIPLGSVVFVYDGPPEEVNEGEIITFRNGNSEGATRTTHRVLDIRQQDGQYQFHTKGDANEEADPGWVSEGQVVGEVLFHIPFLGYILSWAGSTTGFVLLVLIPAVLIILSEVRKIWIEVRNTEEASSMADAAEPEEGEDRGAGDFRNP